MNTIELTQTTGSPSGFPFEANHVRARLGWNKEEFRAVKKSRLAESDYTIFKKRVFLSASAVEKLTVNLGVHLSEKPSPASSGSILRDPVPITRALCICRVAMPNSRLVLACSDGDDPDRPTSVFRVRIRPGTVLRRRQMIVAKPIPPYTDYFEQLPQPFRRAVAPPGDRKGGETKPGQGGAAAPSLS